MNTIELICIIIGAIATILGGVAWIVRSAFKKGIDKNKFDTLEAWSKGFLAVATKRISYKASMIVSTSIRY